MITLLTVLAFGLLPAVQLSGRSLHSTMQLGAQKLAGGWGKRTRNALIAGLFGALAFFTRLNQLVLLLSMVLLLIPESFDAGSARRMTELWRRLPKAASAVAVGGYVNAGQVCISVQRVLVHRDVHGDFLDALQPKVEAIRVGDPFEDGTQLSALISEGEAERVEAAIDRLEKSIGDLPYGFNLIHSPNEPDLEAAVADLYLRRGRWPLRGPTTTWCCCCRLAECCRPAAGTARRRSIIRPRMSIRRRIRSRARALPL